MNISNCIKCKGRFCGNGRFCPVIHKIRAQTKLNQTAKQDFFGAAPNIFVGRHGYPNVNVGFLSVEEYKQHDNPLYWYDNKVPIDQIIDLRTSLINSSFKMDVKSRSEKFLDISREVSLAARPVDVEMHLSKKPIFTFSMQQDAMPHGPNIALKAVQLTENPKIPTRVDKIVSDTDLKAAAAVDELYRHDFDEHYLTKIFSAGNLGVKDERRLVPTRWSITAVDDILGKKMITELKDNKEAAHSAFYGSYFGNHYIILVFPGPWSYELFETVVGEESSFATDYENFEGRKNYADNTAGGYYAARLAILEQMKKLRIRGSVLALRFITKEYWAPLGVWVVRQASRTAMASKPLEFESRDLLIAYARAVAKKRFNFDVNILLRESKLLDDLKRQKRLGQFI
jgi:hypothetical protein